ncbi:MAG TPA: hypothetical protein VGH74_10650, partial [Planctomycetaceae bacterium]
PSAQEKKPALPWFAVERLVAAFPLGDAHRSVRTASEHGCSPEFVLEILSFAQTNRATWHNPAGALRFRLLNAWPRQCASEGWPRASLAAQAETQKSESADRQRVADAEARDAELERARIRAADTAAKELLETEFGPVIDAVQSALAVDFCQSVVDEQLTFAFKVWRRTGSKWPPIGFMREYLLKRLAEKGGAP